MQCQDIGVIDKRQTMVTRIWNVDVRGDLSEKPGNVQARKHFKTTVTKFIFMAMAIKSGNFVFN